MMLMNVIKDTGGGGKPPQEEAGTLLATRVDIERGRTVERCWSWWGIATGCMLVSIVSLGVAILVMEVLRSYDVDQLRTEINILRGELNSLKNSMREEDLMTELKEFEEAVRAEEMKRERQDEDDVDDDEDDDDDDEDADYYDEYAEKIDSLEDKDIINEWQRKLEARNRTKESAREKREIGSGAPVPVIDQSYGRELPPHNQSEGLRLYESLVTTGGKDPKDPTLDWSSTENPIKHYHRVSPLWSSKHGGRHKKYVGAGLQIGSHSKTVLHTTQPPAPIISRVSRVMQTDSNTDTLLHQSPYPSAPPARKPSPLTLRHLHSGRPDGEVVVRVFQEQRGSVGTVLSPGDTPAVTKPRRKKLRRKQLERSEVPEVKPLRLIAHYNGDSSHYTLEHQHYEGNGHLRHPNGAFVDWTPSSWMQKLGMDRYFRIKRGVVSVKEAGMYMVYAQIYYVDAHDINGYVVYQNNDPILYCTTMTVHLPEHEREVKANTCYTSGTVYIEADDTISVRDVSALRYSDFEKGKSFFGLIKLSDDKISETSTT